MWLDRHALTAVLHRFLARLLAERLARTNIKLARAEQRLAEGRGKA